MSSLFGAAVSGVDPQTGSYLSKEQRIAMFRASRGQSVDGGGSGGGGDNKKTKKVVAENSSAIVVANKFVGITKNLQTSYQTATNSVAQQVKKNREGINNIYNAVNQRRQEELRVEKEDTAAKRRERENYLRAAAERIVGGLSTAAANIASSLGKAVQTAIRPLSSIWDRLRRALMFLLAGWAIDNLPEILKTLRSIDFDGIKLGIESNLGNLRGIFVLFEGAFRAILGTIGNVIRIAARIATFVATRIGAVVSRIFGTIAKFLQKVVDGVLDLITNWAKRAFNALGQAFRNAIPRPAAPPAPKPSDAPKLPPGTKPPPKAGNMFTDFLGKLKSGAGKIGRSIIGDEAFEGAKGMVSGAFKNVQKGFSDLSSAVGGTINKGLGAIQQATTGVKANTDKIRVKWLENVLGAITGKFPQLLKGVGKTALGGLVGILKRLPLVGFGIDLALNKGIAGQEWGEAIVRAVGSSISGLVGAKGGAIAGAAAGSLLLPGPGTAIGGAVGAIIGSILAGAIGDELGKRSYEAITGKEASSNTVVGGEFAEKVVDKATEKYHATTHEFDVSDAARSSTQKTTAVIARATTGATTPPALAPSGGGTNIAMIDMPAKVMNTGGETAPAPTTSGEIQNIPNISPSNPDTIFYKQKSLTEYGVIV